MATTTIIWTGAATNAPSNTVNNLYGMDEATAARLLGLLKTGGVAKFEIGDDGHLSVTDSDGQVSDLGVVVGDRGPQGDKGDPGLAGSSAQAPHVLTLPLDRTKWTTGTDGIPRQDVAVDTGQHIVAVMPPQSPVQQAACAVSGIWVQQIVPGRFSVSCMTGVQPTMDVDMSAWYWDTDPSQITVTVPASGWTEDHWQDVDVPGLQWRDAWASPASAQDATAWSLYGLWFKQTGGGSLRAECIDIPAQDIDITISVW